MKRVLGLLSILAVVWYANAQCSAIPDFVTTFLPACDVNDVYIKWPNYWNASTYYTCVAVHRPVLTSCPTGLYFTYVMQMCTPCQTYIPPVPCEKLKTQNPPNCYGGPVTPTAYPPTETEPAGPPVSTPSVPTPPTAPPTDIPLPPSVPPTPPTAVPSPPTAVPTPPTPSTGVPTPPTAEPTPPTGVPTPPTAPPEVPSPPTAPPEVPSPPTAPPEVPSPPTAPPTPPNVF